ncbi:STOMATAL CYTOKINESIS-DEFECTIVE 1 family protein [Hibiscus syriacus]|uniref:STOMATAL CYTOKINESIS-DEFECTIVE 1 family protein n=1 Tax=Hibiscus syriacus TaxID=106335 RepID=A0A6A2ZQS0_HIBSY|nr:STOMATAL CYTOKINESIS-DEFECTIVE 1 family protein [Hibiscus syriacus]
MRQLVDNALAVTKESVKTFTYESLNNIARLINGVSAFLLAILVGKGNNLDGAQGWELRPTFHGPRFPRWMKNGVSSFNQFIHELSVDDNSSADYSSAEDEPDDGIDPLPSSSHGSRTCRTSSHIHHDSHWTYWVAYIFSWILLPVRFLLRIPSFLFLLLSNQESMAPLATVSPHLRTFPSFRKGHTSKDHVVQRTIDRRRGVIEDLHLAIEIFIEAIFDMFHKAAYFVFSPYATFKIFGKWFSSPTAGDKDIDVDALNASVPTSTLGADDPTPRERNLALHHALNTDARTCRDVITELGYPYEAINVITNDGYVIVLERIPRRDARKAVILQHGIMDSSMGWVSNGVVGSPAFAAFDQGYDVFLGNFRGLVSREHVDKNISLRQYWRFSINEHGTEDVPSMIDKIHEVKTAELKLSQPDGEINDEQPYNLCAISHSMGGAAMLMLMKEAGVDVSYNEFEYGHLDFTFSHHEELLAFVMSRLLLVVPDPKRQSSQKKALKLKKTGQATPEVSSD